MLAQVLREVLGKTNSQLLTVYHIQKIQHTHMYTQTVPAGFLSSVLNSSAVRLEKLSSSNGFHAGGVGVSVAPPAAGTAAAPDLFWSCPASLTPS